MSYVSQYEKGLPNGRGIALAAAVHVIVIGAVLTMPAIVYTEKKQGETTIFNIPREEPVKKFEKPVEAKVKLPTKPKTAIVPPRPDTLPPAPDPTKNFGKVADVFDSGGAGTGGVIDFGTPTIEKDPPALPFVGAELNRRYAANFQPDYPAGLLRREVEGAVSVRVLVGIDGRAKQIELISTPDEDFWTATRKQALTKWRFNPATEGGKPVESWLTLKVRFEINQ